MTLAHTNTHRFCRIVEPGVDFAEPAENRAYAGWTNPANP